MIDTHCHLDRCEDPDAAKDNDLRAMVTIGTDPERCRRAVAMAEADPRVWAAVGLHPNDASLVTDGEATREVARLATHERVVGIGETGFDTHWDRESLERQRDAFDWHADLARRLDKPLILHVRDRQGDERASLAAAEAVRAAGHRRGILHCFGGHEDLLRAGLELDWMVSFAGNLTYKNAEPLRAAALLVPLDRLLVETDSPFLAPEPRRGRRNVPANVTYTAERLAEVRGIASAELEPVLDANAERVYGLPSS